MNIKVKIHYMPWEVDYALLQFMQLKKAAEHLSPDDKIYFEIGINLSSYIINWEQSRLPKEFFVNKFNALVKLIDWAEGRVTVYDGDELWGHLDLERDQIEPHIDYYMSICPDMWFHEHSLFYLIEAAKQCKDKYFVITPEIHKLWDASWDELVHDAYQLLPYEQWNQSDIFEIQRRAETLETPFAQQTDRYKWAGWFDIYSKALVEELIPIPAEWKGYGPWDFFGMIVSDIANKNGTPVKEYVLKNQIIFEYHPDKNDKSNFADYYKDMLVLNKIENQRQIIEAKFPYYIEQWKKYYDEIYNNNNN